jgi:hypothetical protein
MGIFYALLESSLEALPRKATSKNHEIMLTAQPNKTMLGRTPIHHQPKLPLHWDGSSVNLVAM